MNFTEAKKVLSLLDAKIISIISGPGLGRTSFIESFAKEKGLNFVYQNLAHFEHHDWRKPKIGDDLKEALKNGNTLVLFDEADRNLENLKLALEEVEFANATVVFAANHFLPFQEETTLFDKFHVKAEIENNDLKLIL